MNHPIQCQCGTLKGYVLDPTRVNHCVCYCKDCQSFAHFLGKADSILDANAGTEIVQTSPANVVITEGNESLACMRLKPDGLLRWYAKCCNTPVGNTLANYKMSFVGLVHNIVENSRAKPLDDVFGPVRVYLNSKSAKGAAPSSSAAATAGAVFRIISMLVRMRLNGGYKRTPFFSVPAGIPVASPKVLTLNERNALLQQT